MVTKEAFIAACEKYSPNWWITFAYKHFSKETTHQYFKLRNWTFYSIYLTFLIGFIGVIFSAPEQLIKISSIIYTIFVFALVLFLFGAVVMNNNRIRKIRKELRITKGEYDLLIGMIS